MKSLILLSALVLLGLVSSCLSWGTIAYISTNFPQTHINYLNVRSQASTSSAIRTTVANGAAVRIFSSTNNGWFGVSVPGGQSGFVMQSSVSTSPVSPHYCECVIWAQRVWEKVRRCKSVHGGFVSAHQYTGCGWAETSTPQRGDIVIHLPCYYDRLGWQHQGHGHISLLEGFGNGVMIITGSNQGAGDRPNDRSCNNVSTRQWPRLAGDACTKYYRPW